VGAGSFDRIHSYARRNLSSISLAGIALQPSGATHCAAPGRGLDNPFSFNEFHRVVAAAF
jgi:hypothetical protein